MSTVNRASAFLDGNKDEVKGFAKALAMRSPADAGAAGVALVVKMLTGSTTAASAAEAYVAAPLGRFLADTPDQRLLEAARTFDAQDEKREALEAFASVVEERIQNVLAGTQGALSHVQGEQNSAGDAFDTLAHAMVEQLDTAERMEKKVTAIKRVLAKLASATRAERRSSTRVTVGGDVIGGQIGDRNTQTNNFGDIVRRIKR
ncbi:MAG: hypothetical protein RLZZ450_2311 [Pseudomonadota bacterium]|jgi:hypothetical protein